MTPSELLSCAPRIAPSKLARIRLLKCKSLGTLVPPGRDGKFLTIALDGKRGPPVRRLPKDVELVEQAAPPPPKLEPQCVNCGAVATLKCSACAAVGGALRGARPRSDWLGRAGVLRRRWWGVGGVGRVRGARAGGCVGRERCPALLRAAVRGELTLWDRAAPAFARGSARRSGGRYTSRCAAIGRR